nr:hypothetical protein [Tanacetum cinerariifolium]
MTESPLINLGFVVPVFSPGDDPFAYLNNAMAFLTVVASLRFFSTNNQLRTSSNPRNQATIQDGRVIAKQVQGRQGETIQVDRQGLLNVTTVKVKDIWLGNSLSLSDQGMQHSIRRKKYPKVPDGQAVHTIILNISAFQTEDLDTYDSDCDDILNAKVILMTNIYNYGSDVISEANVQDTHLQAQQDSMILYVIEKMSEQMINHVNNWEKANKEHNNKSVTAELERYKEQVKTFEQSLNIDLRSREKMIDSQMDDMIKEKIALKEQVDSLEQNLSKQIKEKKRLLQTFTVFKSESKEKEDKYMENKIDLEKKIKELDNILLKWKAQRIKPTLYDGIVTSGKHVAMPAIDDEETLMLEEESRSRMSKKEKDLKAIKQNISYKPIDYVKLNRLTKDFGKRFTPQQELLAEQAFWLRMYDPTSKPSDALPVKIEAPKELPKISLVNERLKKLKFHIAKFDNVVKTRTTPNARTEEIFQKRESCDNQNALEIPQFFENNDLKAQLQEKDSTICKLKDIVKSLREKSKEENVNYDYGEIETKNVELENSVAKLSLENERLRKEIVDIAAQKPSANTIVSGLFMLDLEPLTPSAKKVAVTPKNKVKKVRFVAPFTSSSNIKQVESSKTSDSNKDVLSPTGLKCSTSNCGSKLTGNKKNDRISQTPSKNMKNKVEAQPRNVNKKNRVVEPIHNVDVKQSQLNANS